MGFNIKRRFSTLDDPKPVNRINFCLFCQDGNKHKTCRLIIDITESFALIKFKSIRKVKIHLPEKLRDKKNKFLQQEIKGHIAREEIQSVREELFLAKFNFFESRRNSILQKGIIFEKLDVALDDFSGQRRHFPRLSENWNGSF